MSSLMHDGTGFEFGEWDMEDIEENLMRLMDDVCEASADEWEDPNMRFSVVYHLTHEHQLGGPGVPSFLRMMELNHIYRQIADNEEPIGVLYQRGSI